MTKNFSYDLTVMNKTEGVKQYNEERKGWFSTEASARKGLRNMIAFAESMEEDVISWELFSRTEVLESFSK